MAATAQAQFTPAHNAQQVCRHCRAAPAAQYLSSLRQHLGVCKSLPDSVRAVLDHTAVCESRAGLGCYGGVHASLYRGFRVTGWGVNECRRCGKVIRGWSGALKKHNDHGCSGVAVTWATVDVGGQFEKVDGVDGGAGSKCRHCRRNIPRTWNLKQHLAYCKSLPDSVRAVLDHAAVCESRAGLGCYGGVNASVYRGFRVTGWGVNECRRCGKVFRGWHFQLKRHINSKRCVVGGSATAAAAAPGAAHTPHSTSVNHARAAHGKTSPTTDRTPIMPSCSTRGTKRPGGSAVSAEPSTTIDGGVGWGHGFTVTGSGLKVPLAPMPSRCKRARRVRVSGGSTSATVGCDVGACGPASSSSGPMVV